MLSNELHKLFLESVLFYIMMLCEMREVEEEILEGIKYAQMSTYLKEHISRRE